MIKIQVPATSANVGGGFDCMGIAVDLYNEIYIEESETFQIDTDADIPKTTGNLVYRSLVKTFEFAKDKFTPSNMPKMLADYLENPEKPLPLLIRQVNHIPKTSGLGSSAACIVGGALAANALMKNVLTSRELATFCTKMEGHPDNVLPCLFGGMVAGVVDEKEQVHYMKRKISELIRLCVYTPTFQLETKQSRKVLPPSYPVSDFVYSMSRAVLTFAALSDGNVSMLRHVVGDKIHQPYRSGLIPDYDKVVELNAQCGAIASYLSGAGPSIAAIITKDFRSEKMHKELSKLETKWTMQECAISSLGAKVEILE